MSAEDLTLNIAVNLGRISRWLSEGKIERAKQFLDETEDYLNQLENTPRSERFNPTLEKFKEEFIKLKNNLKPTDEWAELALTWANILTHRAKLA